MSLGIHFMLAIGLHSGKPYFNLENGTVVYAQDYNILL